MYVKTMLICATLVDLLVTGELVCNNDCKNVITGENEFLSGCYFCSVMGLYPSTQTTSHDFDIVELFACMVIASFGLSRT